MTLADLIRLGFDRSAHDEEDGTLTPRCSACEALCIQGVPCHEHGCPNARQAARAEIEDDFEED